MYKGTANTSKIIQVNINHHQPSQYRNLSYASSPLQTAKNANKTLRIKQNMKCINPYSKNTKNVVAELTINITSKPNTNLILFSKLSGSLMITHNAAITGRNGVV